MLNRTKQKENSTPHLKKVVADTADLLSAKYEL